MIVISIIAEIFCKILVLIGKGIVLFAKGLIWIFGGWIKDLNDKKKEPSAESYCSESVRKEGF